MALTSTIYNFEIELADMDRSVYETLALRVARHPSESEEYLVTRVIAYCFEYAEGIAFSKGLSDPDEPTIAVRDLTGSLKAWIEIGTPDAARLHKASKAARRVAVYTHKDPLQLMRGWAGARIHKADEIAFFSVGPLASALAARLARRMAFSISRTGGDVYVAIGEDAIEGRVERIPMDVP